MEDGRSTILRTHTLQPWPGQSVEVPTPLTHTLHPHPPHTPLTLGSPKLHPHTPFTLGPPILTSPGKKWRTRAAASGAVIGRMWMVWSGRG